jgi:ADP-ribosyl-[dinitrogen reductase] hydrolase
MATTKSPAVTLWAIHDADDFRHAVLRAVNLDNDADTTGRCAGAVGRAYWGESDIREEWRDGLARRDIIERTMSGVFVGNP